jgi:hypothetical protein
VTLRAWKILLVGVLAIAASSVLAVTKGHSSPASKTPASWGLYSPREWDAISSRFSRRGFARNAVHVVTATQLANGQAFALIGSHTNTGRTCFAVARGVALGHTICRISKPLTVFFAPDKCAACSPGGPPASTHAALALVRGDVTVTMISQGRESGVGVVPAGTGFALNSSFRAGDRLRARDARGRVLLSISPPA